ncbi:hypothetical protein [Micromonospora sp. NPDC005367]|uniref:hypothetical protein n=1 Tax=Micromonospora sp. NPDC005367 TaxID=3155590 RepID=UPI0033AE5857
MNVGSNPTAISRSCLPLWRPLAVAGPAALVAANLITQQAAQLLPVSRPAGITMSLAALVIAVVGVGWFALRRD